MEIKTEKLSKYVLVKFVNHLIDQGSLDRKAIPAFYKVDLRVQLRKIKDSMDRIDIQLKNEKLSIKANTVLVEKFNKLVSQAQKKIKLLEQLEKEAPDATNKR